MRVKLQLVICHDDDHEETITDVATAAAMSSASRCTSSVALEIIGPPPQMSSGRAARA